MAGVTPEARSDRYFDALETRDPAERERDLFSRLPGFLAKAMSEAPGWAKLLQGIDPKGINSREALAQLPVLRKSALVELQTEAPPFGGLVAASARIVRQFVSPGPIHEPQGDGPDFWRVARPLHAAGIRPGDLVHNAFAYHLTPAGHMFEQGALALGCAVVPAGTGNTEIQVETIERLKPRGYTGTPDFLKVLLDTAEEVGRDATSIKRALVSAAALPPSLRSELSGRGVETVQCYGTADLGIVAYESPGCEGMIVDEDVIVEIVRPGTGDPVIEGEVGEVVVTSLNPVYPLIRFATGDLSAAISAPSPCGRTNMRIRGWMGRADQATKIKGMFVNPGQIAEIGRRHGELGRLRAVVTRDGQQDVLTLKAETTSREPGLASAVEATLQSVCKLRGRVELVPPGSLPNDGRVIADERDYV